MPDGTGTHGESPEAATRDLDLCPCLCRRPDRGAAAASVRLRDRERRRDSEGERKGRPGEGDFLAEEMEDPAEGWAATGAAVEEERRGAEDKRVARP